MQRKLSRLLFFAVVALPFATGLFLPGIARAGEILFTCNTGNPDISEMPIYTSESPDGVLKIRVGIIYRRGASLPSTVDVAISSASGPQAINLTMTLSPSPAGSTNFYNESSTPAPNGDYSLKIDSITPHPGLVMTPDCPFSATLVGGGSLGGSTGFWGLLGTIGGLEYEDAVAVLKAVTKILITIGLLLAIARIIQGGYLIMTSQGNEQQLTDGKDILTSAVMGLVFTVIGLTLLDVLLRMILK